MNPTGQGDLPAGAAAFQESIEEKQRAELGIVTDTQMQTEPLSEKPPATPVSPDPKSPTSAVSPGTPTSQTSDSDAPPDLSKYDSKIVQIRDIPEGDAALEHLPDHEKVIIKRQLDIPDTKVTYWTLYRYATRYDKLFITIACITAIGAGAVLPLMTVVFGNLSGNFVSSLSS
jgi:ATP-binding cassette, subfamily B (MDR/TAP), member 1